MEDNIFFNKEKNAQYNKESNLKELQKLINKKKNLKNVKFENEIKNQIQIFPSINLDNKVYFLLTRTLYIKEFEKIEKFINKEDLLNKKININDEQYSELISYLDKLSNLQYLYLIEKDYIRSLQIKNKIIDILKNSNINLNINV